MPWKEYILTGGLERKAPADRIGDGQLQRARGCIYDTLGAIKSDPGRVPVRFYGYGGIAGVGDGVIDGTRYLFTKSGVRVFADGAQIGSFGAAGKHISVVPYNGYVYIADGEVFQRYSVDKGLEDVGLDPPDVTGLGVAFSGSGNGLSAGEYKWVWTFYNGVAESNFSDPIAGTAAAGEKADVDVPQTWPASATEARLYRTVVGGSAYFRVGEVTSATPTTYEDTGGLIYNADPDANETDEVSDEPRRQDSLRPPSSPWPKGETPVERKYKKKQKLKDDYKDKDVLSGDIVQTNLGILADWNDHDKPPESIKHLRFVGDRIYGIDGNNLRFTKIAAPEHWSEYNSVPIGRQTGETLLTIEPYGSDVICYTDSGIWRFRALGEDATDSQLIQVESQIGLVSEHAVATLDNGMHVFLGSAGVYVFDGREVSEISYSVEPFFYEVGADSDYLANTENAVAGALRDKVWISYGNGQATGNNRTLFIDLQDMSQPKFSVLLYGATTLRRTLDSRLLGGDDQGRLFALGGNRLGFDSEGSSRFDVVTKEYPFQGATQRESYDRVVFDVDPGGEDMGAVVSTDTGSAVGFTLNWKGRRKLKRWLPASFSGHTVRVSFTSIFNVPRAVYGVGFGVDSEDEP